MNVVNKVAGRSSELCCVYGCVNALNSIPGTKFYKFPNISTQTWRRIHWTQFVQRFHPLGSQWSPKSNTLICNSHFINKEVSDNPKDPSYNPTYDAQNDPTQQIEPEDNKKAIKCLVPNCPTSYPDKDYDIFKIPASRSWYFDWIDKLSCLPEWGGICEKHFHKTDVFKDSSGKKHLKVSAVPKFSLDSIKTSNDGSSILDVVEVIDSRIYEGIKGEVDVDEPSSIEPEISKKGEKETHKNRVIDLCRLCIKLSQNFRRINSKLKKMIQMCTSVKIDNDPVFPNHLCLQCFNSIAQCYEFRINSEEADRKLHELIAEDQSSPPSDPASIEQVEEPEPVQSTVYVCNDNQIFESHNEHQEPEVRPHRVYPARKRKQNFRSELKLLDANLPSIATTFSLSTEDDRLNVSETPSNEPKKLKQNEGINKEKCQMYVVIPDGGIVPAITPTPEKPAVLAMYTLNKASAKKQKIVKKKIESRKLLKRQPDVLVIDDSE